jgi:hypothetical protein
MDWIFVQSKIAIAFNVNLLTTKLSVYITLRNIKQNFAPKMHKSANIKIFVHLLIQTKILKHH